MNYNANGRNQFRRGSALVNFSFILALVSCAASAYLYFQWNSLSAEKKGFEAVRIQLEDQIASLETDLQASLKEQQKLKKAAEASDSDKVKALAELEQFEVSADKLQADLKKLKAERDSLKKIAVQLKTQAGNLISSAAAATSSGVQNAASVPAARLQASSEQPAEPMKVKTINRTFNFVVFDLVPGVTFRVGDDAVVERNGRWISNVKIKQVYAQFASAEIRKEDENNLLQIGDFVKRV